MRMRNSGFTLIELMIVVVVVAILSAIAYPSYTQYVERARRADGKAALLDVAQRLERCHTQSNTYVGCVTFPLNSPDGHYTLPAPTGTALAVNSFTITAVPVRADPRCGTLSLTHTGVQGATGTLGAGPCW